MDKQISGKTIAGIIDAQTKQLSSQAKKLIIIKATDEPSTVVWIKQKMTKAAELGLTCEVIEFPNNALTNQVIDAIVEKNNDESVGGILVQLPLYQQLEAEEIINAVDPTKDVDGLTALNQGYLATNPRIIPATVAAILEIIKYKEIDLTGKHVVIVNHSTLIGRPLAQLLLNQNATVTICHKFTQDLGKLTAQADILVTAAGKEGLINYEMIKAGSLVIDVSTIKTADGLKGDVIVNDEFLAKVGSFTPVPGGVGPVTVACLFNSLVKN